MIAEAGLHRIDCVLFDLYGTLVDIEVDEDSPALWIGLSARLQTSGVSVDANQLRSRFRSILREECDRRREGFIMEPVFERLRSSFGFRDDVGRIGRLFRQLSLTTLALRPYVEPLLETLRGAGSRTGIVSNTEAVLTRFDLEHLPVLRTVDAVVLSSEVGVRKPDPHIFRLVLERLHAAPASAVFIGNDWTADVVGAREAGMSAIYVHERATSGSDASETGRRVVQATPTLEAIVAALHRCGWRGHAA